MSVRLTSTLNIPYIPNHPRYTFAIQGVNKQSLPLIVFDRKFPELYGHNMEKNLEGLLDKLRSTKDDDPIDRLNYVTTIYLLIAFALLLFAKSYVGEPMQCWVPKQWTGKWEAFSESYCFVENTYFVPMNDSNLPAVQTREGKEMIYYQWVPFILLIMAMFFYIPRLVWKIFAKYSGLALTDLMSAARSEAKKGEVNEAAFAGMASQINHRIGKPQTFSMKYGEYLFNLYLLVKTLILVNLVIQFVLLNQFLNEAWGFGILFDMINGRQWQQSGHFPRVAFCDLVVRELGNVNNWTVQCVLMVNMFNEKIFIFFWFWYAFVCVSTVINYFVWIIRRLASSRRSFVDELLAKVDIKSSSEEREHFFQSVLKDDGVLVLRFLDSNAGRLQSCELIKQLWNLSRRNDKDDEEETSA